MAKGKVTLSNQGIGKGQINMTGKTNIPAPKPKLGGFNGGGAGLGGRNPKAANNKA